MANVTPYTLVIAGSHWHAGKTRKNGFTPITRQRSAWQGWTADQSAEAGRLAGSGSFVYNGGVRAVAAARAYLRQGNVDQVQIRTNQDRKVIVYNKCANGTITHYDARD
jgi:hypothetical protein